MIDSSFHLFFINFPRYLCQFARDKRDERGEKNTKHYACFNSTRVEWIPEIAPPLKIITRRRLRFYVRDVKDPREGSAEKNQPPFLYRSELLLRRTRGRIYDTGEA